MVSQGQLSIAKALLLCSGILASTHLIIISGWIEPDIKESFLSPLPFSRPAWSDLDRDGLDTRADMIATVCQVAKWNTTRTRVLHAECPDLYDSSSIATDTVPQSIQIDHLYPASVAWYRRAWAKADGTPCTTATDCAEYRQFYNDVLNLTVTRSKTNNDKRDYMPAAWCPADRYARLSTAVRFKLVAEKWSLPLNEKDVAGLAAWSRGECTNKEN